MQSVALEPQACPLCGGLAIETFYSDRHRDYLRCKKCALVFVPKEQRLGSAEEKAIYDLHENNDNDPGYRRFLSRLAEPLLERIPANSEGLDFGCGPGPVLAKMLSQAGHKLSLYDHFYCNEASVLERPYDFITATEVLEHLFQPGVELARLWTCLKPCGWLGVMTKLVIDKQAFSRWHYKNDLTHVSFFSRCTFEWLAENLGANPTFIGKDVIFLQKPSLSKG